MQALLPVHVLAGGLAIIVGLTALFAAKGASLHRKSGMAFVAAMIVMGTSGSVLALRHGLNANAMGGFMSAYMVVTAWTTVRRPTAGARQLEIGALLLALALGLLNLFLGSLALSRPRAALDGVPAPAFFVFATVALLAAAGDARVIRSGIGGGAPRLRRHLWRMCFALFIATGSFFSIRARVAKVLPGAFLGSGFRTFAVLFPILVMLYWLWRVRARRGGRSVGALTLREAT